jgi:hypothetical protein
MRTLFFLGMLPLLVAHLAVADDNDFAVGTCKPKLTSFSTIQAAVSAVPPGSTVLVCPGVYPEQVTISRPLTLQGIADSNLDQIVITVPGTGLANVMSVFGELVATQVLVLNASPVNITNIAVDGTGGDQACATSGIWLAGIFYGSGSSGEVSRVRASGQLDGGCGVGIWAENGVSSNQYVTVQGSSVHDVDGFGISVGSSGTTSTLSVTVRDNVVFPNIASAAGIVLNSVNGEITDNDVSNALFGLFASAPGARISSNNVTSTNYGVVLIASGTVRSNDISNSSVDGVVLSAPGATVESNRIMFTASVGIEFDCFAGTVAHNTINDATIGLADVPASFNGPNTFANTATAISLGTGCPALSSVKGASRLGGPSSFPRWRTPANPSGVHP